MRQTAAEFRRAKRNGEGREKAQERAKGVVGLGGRKAGRK